MDILSLISEALAPLSGRRIVDIGCGTGTLAQKLTAAGARVDGVDPSEPALQTARIVAPDAAFHCAEAGALPYETDCFDGAVFVNSLHHVPAAQMGPALREALRVLRPSGRLIVVEPLTTGSQFRVLLVVEDETVVRAQAQAAVRACVDQGHCTMLREIEFDRVDLLSGFDEFTRRLIAVDRARETVFSERQAAVRAAFLEHAERQDDGRFALHQPLRVQILSPTPSAAG